jgi:hypothetical protein
MALGRSTFIYRERCSNKFMHAWCGVPGSGHTMTLVGTVVAGEEMHRTDKGVQDIGVLHNTGGGNKTHVVNVFATCGRMVGER